MMTVRVGQHTNKDVGDGQYAYTRSIRVPVPAVVGRWLERRATPDKQRTWARREWDE